MAGCTYSPPRRPDGLPIVPRYTNTIQLDWILDSYRQVAGDAINNAQVSTLLEDACLGWERTAFDLGSARLYPTILRMSTDAVNLERLFAQFPEIIARHPRPATCDPLTPNTPPLETPAATSAPAAAADAAAPTATAASADAASTAPAATTPAPTTIPAAAAETGVVVAAPESPVVKERQLLARLRTALGLNANTLERTGGENAQPVDLATIEELAKSENPAIRLRASFHLVGQCVLGVEHADRAFLGSKEALDVIQKRIGGCATRKPAEPLRSVEVRLKKSMLVAFRGRHLEPFGDIVLGLATFVARDNPPLDGPRISR